MVITPSRNEVIKGAGISMEDGRIIMINLLDILAEGEGVVPNFLFFDFQFILHCLNFPTLAVQMCNYQNKDSTALETNADSTITSFLLVRVCQVYHNAGTCIHSKV